MSKPNLPPYPTPHPVAGHRMFSASQVEAHVQKAVNAALAVQVASINAALAGMSMDGVNGGAVQKEYFKAGARRAIQAVNSALAQGGSNG